MEIIYFKNEIWIFVCTVFSVFTCDKFLDTGSYIHIEFGWLWHSDSWILQVQKQQINEGVRFILGGTIVCFSSDAFILGLLWKGWKLFTKNEIWIFVCTVFSVFGCDKFLDASGYIRIEFWLIMAFRQLDTTSTKAINLGGTIVCFSFDVFIHGLIWKGWKFFMVE